MHDSKVIDKAQYGKTFQEAKIINNAKFAHVVIASDGEKVPTEAIKWQRFERLRTNDYVRMAYPGYYTWDAICFVPKEDIWFFGFGCMSSEERRDITLQVKWDIDGSLSDQHEISFLDGDRCPEKSWHTIDIRNFDVQPIKVHQGQKIHIMMRVTAEHMKYFFYGQYGDQTYYSKIEGQGYDFEVERSSYNDNNTSVDTGHIPFIYYAK